MGYVSIDSHQSAASEDGGAKAFELEGEQTHESINGQPKEEPSCRVADFVGVAKGWSRQDTKIYNTRLKGNRDNEGGVLIVAGGLVGTVALRKECIRHHALVQTVPTTGIDSHHRAQPSLDNYS